MPRTRWSVAVGGKKAAEDALNARVQVEHQMQTFILALPERLNVEEVRSCLREANAREANRSLIEQLEERLKEIIELKKARHRAEVVKNLKVFAEGPLATLDTDGLAAALEEAASLEDMDEESLAPLREVLEQAEAEQAARLQEAQLDVLRLLASPIAYIDGYVAPAMLVSVGDRPDQPGTHGYIVRQTSERYARALREHGHHAVTVHDDDENHTTLATGFGAPDDAVTRHVDAFLATLK